MGMTRLLEAQGFGSAPSPTTQAALDAIRHEPAELVVTDMVIPHLEQHRAVPDAAQGQPTTAAT